MSRWLGRFILYPARDLIHKLLIRIEGLVAVVIRGAFSERLADHDWTQSIESNAGLRALDGDQRRMKWQEVKTWSEGRFLLLRRALVRSALLLSSAVAAAWTTSLGVGNTEGEVQGVRLYGILSITLFVWATLGRMGWKGQTIKGETIAEKTDELVFRILYWFGTYFGALGILLQSDSIENVPLLSRPVSDGPTGGDLIAFVSQPGWLPYLAGYFVSVILGHIGVRSIVPPLYRMVGDSGRPVSTGILGMVERALLTTAVLVGHVEFLGLWITLKLAGNWRHIAGELDRHKFNCFLIGNGLSVLYAYTGARVIGWVQNGGTEVTAPPLLVVLMLVASTFALGLYAWTSYWLEQPGARDK